MLLPWRVESLIIEKLTTFFQKRTHKIVSLFSPSITLYREKIDTPFPQSHPLQYLLHSFFPQIDLVQVAVRKDKEEDAIFFNVHSTDDLKAAEEKYEELRRKEPEVFVPVAEAAK